MGAGPVGSPWTSDELRARLRDGGREVQHLALIVVSPSDLDVQQARIQAANRRRSRMILAGVAVAFIALVLFLPQFRVTVGSGLGAMWVWWGVLAVVQHQYRPRVGAVAEGSQAESFVLPLLSATSETQGVVSRWLGWNEPFDAVLLTQEERWSYAGALSELRTRWTADEGAITRIEPAGRRWRPLVRFTFVDGSTVVLDLPRASRSEVLEQWPPVTDDSADDAGP